MDEAKFLSAKTLVSAPNRTSLVFIVLLRTQLLGGGFQSDEPTETLILFYYLTDAACRVARRNQSEIAILTS